MNIAVSTSRQPRHQALLVKRRALGLHMGTSPYYWGTACNFWALYDRELDYVGATIHLLTEEFDSGPMQCHALPGPDR